MKRLFIHIKDKTTDFLEDIYNDLQHTTIVRTELPPYIMNSLIKTHDQVIMMGHGSPNGLFGDEGQFIIGEHNVDALQEHSECVYIWCHASDFVKRHKLKGFSTGMFISEVPEARIVLNSNKSSTVTEHNVFESNKMFTTLVKIWAQGRGDVDELYDSVVQEYTSKDTIWSEGFKHVVDYNAERIGIF